jgi:hypothetical protein
MLRRLRLLALLLGAFALANTAAHVLELAPKMRLDLEQYSAVNGTLYRYFAIVGGPAIVLTILCTAAVAFLVRGRRPAFAWSVVATALFAAAFGSWLALVAPVNARVAAVEVADRPAVWSEERPRWEYGHAVGFALHFLGFAALAWSVVAETGPRRTR